MLQSLGMTTSLVHVPALSSDATECCVSIFCFHCSWRRRIFKLVKIFRQHLINTINDEIFHPTLKADLHTQILSATQRSTLGKNLRTV